VLGSGPHVTGRLGSGMQVSASFKLREIALYRLAHGGGGRGKCTKLTPCKKRGELTRGECPGSICPRGKCPGENVLRTLGGERQTYQRNREQETRTLAMLLLRY